MKLEIYSGDFVGTAEYKAPGQVELDMPDAEQRQWFEKYFSAEDSFLDGPVECAEMEAEQRNSSEPAFERAAFQLAGYAYEVKRGDGRRHDRHDLNGRGASVEGGPQNGTG